MGMDPRRLLVLHSNLMRTDAVSIRISDSIAQLGMPGRSAAHGIRRAGK